MKDTIIGAVFIAFAVAFNVVTIWLSIVLANNFDGLMWWVMLFIGISFIGSGMTYLATIPVLVVGLILEMLKGE